MSSFPELDKYIAEARQEGLSNEQIRQELIKVGWNPADIDAVINLAPQTPPVITKSPEVKEVPDQKLINNIVSPVSEIKPIDPKQAPVITPFNVQMPAAEPAHRSSKLLLVITVIILFVAFGGVGFAYFMKIGPFAKIPYTEANLISGLLGKFSDIKTASYAFSTSFNVGPRDPGALPFTIQVSNEGPLRQQYQNDSDRSKSISNLLFLLRLKNGKYPATLDALKPGNSMSGSNFSVNDPISQKPYTYTLTDSGKNFALTASFETDNAISTISKSYGFVATTTIINNKNVTFTKDSSQYLYLPTEPPKPFLVSLSDSVKMLPPAISAQIAAGATTDWTSSSQSDWKFNLDGSGDFGDLTYAVNVDALRKAGSYYFRINKIPSLFLASIASIKGQWVKIDPSLGSTASSILGGYNEFSSIASQFPNSEDAYKKSNLAMIDFIKKTAGFADSENLFTFKNPPNKETVDNQSLYKFDLKINRGAILPFYRNLVAEAAKNPDNTLGTLTNDQGALEYLQSKEFDDVFNYLDQNTNVTVWADQNGFPAILQYTMRVVPPDTAVQLKDKQANLIFKLVISGINEPVTIDVPTNTKPIQQVIDEFTKNQSDYNGTTSVLATKERLSQVRISAELLYDKVKGYGTKVFPMGVCTQAVNTLFEDKNVYEEIKTASGGDASKATCVSTMTGGKVTSYAVSVPLETSPGYSWCIDSTGASKQITGSLSGSVCK